MHRVRSLAAGVATLAALCVTTFAPVGGSAQAAEAWCGGERPPRLAGGQYSCTWEDNFDGRWLNRDKWTVQQTARTGVPAPASGCYVDDRRTVSVGQGTLRLTSERTSPFTCSNPYGDYSATNVAATVTTAGKFNQAYGRFEFRARFPNTTASGVHSALWLHPSRLEYGAWPKSGEIDVAEWYSAVQDNVYPSVHYDGRDYTQASGYNCVITDTQEYHRYAVEWTPEVMRFLYDGQVCFEHSWTPSSPLTAPQPFDKPFNVVLSQAFGVAWNAITSKTPRSATMYVDWVRVWQ